MIKNKKLKEILGPTFEDYFGKETIELKYQKDGVWHSHPTPYDCKVGILGPMTPTVFKLSELKNQDLCEKCFSPDQYYNPLIESDVYRQAEWVVSQRMALNSKAKITKTTSAGAIQGRLAETAQIIKSLEQKIYDEGKPRPQKMLKELLELAKETQEKLEAETTSDQAKAKLEAAVQARMVPKSFKAQKFALDSSMVLIGISPTPSPSYWRNTTLDTVQAVLGAYAIRQDSVTVLHAPAYFYSYLLGTLFYKNKESTLVVSVPAPEGAEARENAAFLWDPLNQSELACLSKSTQTGEALSG